MPLKVTTRKGRSGLWIVGTVAGVRVRESAGTDNRALAEEIRSRREQQIIRTGLYGTEAETTFSQAAIMYLEHGGDHRYLKRVIQEMGERRLSEIKPGEVRDVANKLYPDGQGSTKNRQVIVPFNAVLNYACDRGLARPMKIKRFAETKPIRRAADRQWLDAFIQAAPDWCGALALVMFTSGMRIGEALQLRPEDIRSGEAICHDTKNGASHAYHLIPSAQEAIGRLRPRNGRVFGFLSRRHVYSHWKRACMAAGIEYIPPHQAGRHSFATEMIVRNGVDVATTARAANWKSPKLLLDRYAHAERVEKAVDHVFGRLTPARHQTKVTPRKLPSKGAKR